MADYSSQTVAQLKEVLKSRELSTDGKKADLVQRLVDNDSETSQAQPAEVEPVEEKKEEKASESKQEEVSEETAEQEEVAQEPKEEEKPKTLSAEERATLAIDLLNKKISRAEKFGDEAAAEAARKDLSRVKKFGVALGTSLAREIGIVDDKLGNGNSKKSHFSKGQGFGKFKKNDKVSKPKANGKKSNYKRTD